MPYQKKIRFIGGPLDGAEAIIEMDTPPPDSGPLAFNGMRFQVQGDIARYLDGGPINPNDLFIIGGQ